MTVNGDKITVVGGGGDIWNASDNFYYAYMPVTGDFDYVVKVESLVGNSGDGGWSKAELMARLPAEGSDTPDGADPHISNMVTRPASDTANSAPAGVNNRGPQWRAHRAGDMMPDGVTAWNGASSWTTPNPTYPPNPPDQWVRLERVGSVFYMYTSNDGTTWNMYNPYSPQGWDTAGSWPPGADNPDQAFFTNAWPAKILLGLAVTAHNDADVSTAVFSGFKQWTPVAIALNTQPPATVDIPANNKLELSVAATGDPVHYQWRRDGNPIPQAVGPTYTVALAKPSDSGKYTVRVFGGGKEIISSECIVTVTEDKTPPTIVSAKPVMQTGINIRFSEPVTAPSATTTSNYKLDPSVAVTGASLSADGYVVSLTTAQQTLDTKYTLTVNGVKDTSGNTIATDTKVLFTSVSLLTGYAFYERWDDASGDMGDLTQFGTALDDGSARLPDINSILTQFGAPWGVADNYNARVRTYFTPPSNGNYVFFVSSDDNSNVYLSTDANPANKKLICRESGWSNQYQWTAPGAGTADDKRSDLFSGTEWDTGNTITLQGNKTYYMEVRVNEGGGGDGVDVTFIKEGEADPSNDANGMHMKGTVISWYESKDVLPPVINTHPVDNLVLGQGESATLSVVATNPGSDVLKYQWTLNGVDIPGATSASYTIASATVADMGQYRVKVSNKNATVWSGDGAPNPTIVMVKATGVFAIEGEDFDYDSGQTKAEASTMPYLGGAYNGLSAVLGVDYQNDDDPGNNVTGEGHPVYRWGGPLGTNADDPNTSATTSVEQPGGLFAVNRLGEWTMTTNYKLGWVGTGNWGNYTRTFPTPAKKYNVFASSSYDGVNDGQLNGTVGMVTAGVGTSSQTVVQLASYTAQGSGDWSRNNLVGARGADGKLTEVEIGGKQTIRWTYNSGDAEALLFVPISGGTVGSAKISLSGNSVTISEDPAGGSTVQSAPAVTGPWTDVGPAPQTQAVGSGAKFYRLKK